MLCSRKRNSVLSRSVTFPRFFFLQLRSIMISLTRLQETISTLQSSQQEEDTLLAIKTPSYRHLLYPQAEEEEEENISTNQQQNSVRYSVLPSVPVWVVFRKVYSSCCRWVGPVRPVRKYTHTKNFFLKAATLPHRSHPFPFRFPDGGCLAGGGGGGGKNANRGK